MYINKYTNKLVEAFKWTSGAELPEWLKDLANETQDYRYGTPVLQHQALPTIKRLAREGEYILKMRGSKVLDTMGYEKFEKEFTVATEEQIAEVDLAEARLLEPQPATPFVPMPTAGE